MEILKLDPEDLILYSKNSKKHPDKQIKKIMASIKEFGFNNPVLIDKKNIIIAGHGRVIAAEQLKRVCYMMEIDEKYCQVIINRWEKLTGKKAELQNKLNEG